MADQQEQFSYAEYKTYKRVARILAEGGEAPTESKRNTSESYDPYEADQERLNKLYEERERKTASITPEQLKEVDKVLDGIRW